MTRLATTTDLSTIIDLQQSVTREAAIFGYHPDSQEEWEKRDITWTWIATENDQLVGFIHCSPRPVAGECIFPPGSQVIEIIDLIVAASARRRRRGHSLLNAVQTQVRLAGFTHLRVYSAAKRFDEILRFDREHGFTSWYLEMTQEL